MEMAYEFDLTTRHTPNLLRFLERMWEITYQSWRHSIKPTIILWTQIINIEFGIQIIIDLRHNLNEENSQIEE